MDTFRTLTTSDVNADRPSDNGHKLSETSLFEPSVAEPKLLTLEEVAKLLDKSDRTVRRYVTHGHLTPHYKSTETGREIRFSEDDVNKLLSDMSRSRPEHLDNRPDSDRNRVQMFSGTIDIKEFLGRYEHLLGQLGYFQAKAEEVKLLTERAESLNKANQDLEQKLSTKDAELIQQQLAAQATETELKKQINGYKTRERWQPWVTIAIAIFALIIGFVIAPAALPQLAAIVGLR
jgi:excisionase family DNA binding protein